MSNFKFRKAAILVAIMSIISATRVTRVVGEIRPVDFVVILGLGICCGVMLSIIIFNVKYGSGDGSHIP